MFANSVPDVDGHSRVGRVWELGGATPCFIALTSEYSPARLRAALVTLMWSAFPLGGLLGGLLNWYLIPRAGWRAIFYIGGVAPLVLAAVLFLYLPKSIKFLLVQRNDMKGVGRIVLASARPLCGATCILSWTRSPCPVPRFGTCSRKAARLERYCCGFRFHGFRRAHGRGLVDACAIEAQRHFAGQHRLRRRFQWAWAALLANQPRVG